MYQLQRACEVQVNTVKMGQELRPLDETVLMRTVRQSQGAVAKGFDKASGFGEDAYVALVRQLDAAGQNFRD
jgi:hypothetical protein